MKNQFKILIIIAVIAVAAVGYYAYTQYNILKTQEYIKTSQELKDNATNYFNQAASYEKSGNYPDAITSYQKSKDTITKALNQNKQALTYATGVYREYLNNDIMLLEKTAKLTEYRIYINQYRNNSLNPGQEEVNPTVLNPYMDDLEKEIANYNATLNQIINSNPEEFKFLKLN